ncbi:hem peroxidase superfamily [Arabidopsis suecica]|uniref:peroxidase n=1 Tax=Arabidopsis suecica TaxID=45249 RepID=A0A8T2G682_ARASU|nr:hem peroxidase superfamily [Arabidopsis suecica]
MANKSLEIRFLFPLVLFLVVKLLCVDGKGFNNNGHKIRKGRWEGKLKMNFYHSSCPGAEDIVRQIVWKKVEANRSLAPKLLRVHYHDCFVRGCDASLLLDSVAGKAASEKEARPNLSLSGFEIIDEIKSILEKRCPNTVSCADILTLAARDAVSYEFERPLWNVFTGRVDGRVSLATEAARDLPSAGANFTTLQKLFAESDLDVVDLVALSGAHTIGIAHCGVFGRRLLNFTGKGDTDPSLNPSYASFLKSECSDKSLRLNPSAVVGMDPTGPLAFDSGYFVSLLKNKGLFTSDAALLTDPSAAHIASVFQNSGAFLAQFGRSMIKMSSIKVLTLGDQGGEIRKNCRLVN